MLELIQRVEFWVSVGFAVLIKIRASKAVTGREALWSTVIAILGAAVFTDFVVEWQGVQSDNGKFAIAAVVALTCEHIARKALSTIDQVSVDDLLKKVGLRK